MHKLSGVVQNYAWGDPNYLAGLLQQQHDEPQAEYWLGAHPRGASSIGDSQTLGQLIAERPIEMLGEVTSGKYNQLPYLVKILAAAKPLSIQCHPSKSQAEDGFERETMAGIPRDSPVRTYRDNNHKPELICALTDFEAKVGFRSLGSTVQLFEALGKDEPTLNALNKLLQAPGSESEVLASVLRYLLGAEASSSLVRAVVEGSERLCSRRDFNLGDEPRAALKWTAFIHGHFPGDIGVVVALLLNHISLKPGQAIALGSGSLHAYVKGVGVEVMANSDNVVRGGLTQKHVDIDELLSVVSTEPSNPTIDSALEPIYQYMSPFREFFLTRILAASDVDFTSSGPEIWLATEGEFELRTSGDSVLLVPGGACFVAADEASVTVNGWGQCWRVAIA